MASYNAMKDVVFNEMGQGSDMVIVKRYSHLPIVFLEVTSQAAFSKILKHKKIISINEDKMTKATLASSLPSISQPAVISSGVTGNNTTIVIADSGLDYTRAAFGNCTSVSQPASCRVAAHVDISPNDGMLDDPNLLNAPNHGTHVAGIAAGVAPGAKLISLDIFNGNSAPDSDIVDSINWAIQNKAQYNIVAINLSVGRGVYSGSACLFHVVYWATANANSAGITVIAASGNDSNASGISSPACIPGVVSVGSVSDTGTISSFSNSTALLDLLAPGASISAAGIFGSGTSMATPHVSGAIALLSQQYNYASPKQKKEILQMSGTWYTDPRNGVRRAIINVEEMLGGTRVYSVGVIPHSTNCPENNERVQIYMDDEDSGNANSRSGWTGGISSSSNTTFRFCHVNGLVFKDFNGFNNYTYAVVKLGLVCPNGSEEYWRYFDNEDSNNNNWRTGALGPLYSGSNTRLRLCVFPSGFWDNLGWFWPNLGFAYGVFVDPTVTGNKVIQSGYIHTDDEDSWNANSRGGSSYGVKLISGSSNSDINIGRVQ